MLEHNHNPSTGEVEVGGSEVQSHPWLYCEFEASLGYVRPNLKKKKKKDGQVTSVSDCTTVRDLEQ